MKKTLRLFLDTNVWFSALYGSRNCLRLVQAANKNAIHTVISPEVLDELLVNLKKKIPHTLALFEDMLLTAKPKLIGSPQRIPAFVQKLVDIKDQKIFASAIEGSVAYFITGNTRDFKKEQLKKKTGILILIPKEAVSALRL